MTDNRDSARGGTAGPDAAAPGEPVIADRAAEKRESRRGDLERLADGRVSAADLRRENGLFSGLNIKGATIVQRRLVVKASEED